MKVELFVGWRSFFFFDSTQHHANRTIALFSNFLVAALWQALRAPGRAPPGHIEVIHGLWLADGMCFMYSLFWEPACVSDSTQLNDGLFFSDARLSVLLPFLDPERGRNSPSRIWPRRFRPQRIWEMFSKENRGV